VGSIENGSTPFPRSRAVPSHRASRRDPLAGTAFAELAPPSRSQALSNEYQEQRLPETTAVQYEPPIGGAVQVKAKYYRELAERCRKLAEDIPDAEANAHMLDVARQYEKLAEEAQANSR
jgi:hypothetical protein